MSNVTGLRCLVIATKGGLVRPDRRSWVRDGRPDHLRGAVEGSLQRLRLERIALYQLHAPDPNVPFAESVGALADLQRIGKIRHIGISNVTVARRDLARSSPHASARRLRRFGLNREPSRQHGQGRLLAGSEQSRLVLRHKI
ncbi:aldo/keto reductase [Cupriavidus basilensis]|uniref:aldo/keto reductase n=1 Tax=Cupriavidus basilensis TaxID=68895 RepID=UPI001C2D3CF4